MKQAKVLFFLIFALVLGLLDNPTSKERKQRVASVSSTCLMVRWCRK